jgi:hypothetical protein
MQRVDPPGGIGGIVEKPDSRYRMTIASIKTPACGAASEEYRRPRRISTRREFSAELA